MAVQFEVSSQGCRSIVVECLDHLFKIIGPRGKFVYAHRFGNISRSVEGYNLLRHCGTVWFMCKSIDRLSLPIDLARERLLASSVTYILEKLEAPVWIDSAVPALCLPSRTGVKIGGGGLCLLMLEQLMQLMRDKKISGAGLPDLPALEIICEKLENYLLAEIVDGDFIHKRSRLSGEILPFRSDYYTGEVLFGLINRGRSPEPAAKLLSGLIDRDYGIAEQSHWMAYAASAAVRVQLPQKEKTFQYLDRLMSYIIAAPEYRERYQSTPIACRTEALLAYLEVATCRNLPLPDQTNGLVAQALATAQENFALQLTYYGNGQFKRGRDSDLVQIDYIQHNGASALGLMANLP